jgi:hypothetical protein
MVLNRNGEMSRAVYDESAPQIASFPDMPAGQDLTTLTSWEMRVARHLVEQELDLCDHTGTYCRKLD